jgi:hypothetical protein
MARYFRRGTTKVYFEPTIADTDAPTEAELATATELSCELAEISGFSFSNNPIDVPDMCDVFVKKIPGEDAADDSSMTFYEDSVSFASNTILSTLAKGTEGYILLFPYGLAGATPAAGDECEVWPVSVASNTREWNAGNEPARFMVEFTITDVPDQAATVVS